MELPNQEHFAGPDIFVSGDKGHFFGKGGCDKQAVKRIPVYQRQTFKGREVSGLYGEYYNVSGGNYAHTDSIEIVPHDIPDSIGEFIIAIEEP